MKTLRSLSSRQLIEFGYRINAKYEPALVPHVARHMRCYKLAKRIIVEIDRRMGEL